MVARWRLLGVVALILPWLLTAGYLVTLPEVVLTTNLLVDDSLYYTVPARNFWAGNGLSFDGLEATNGVQTLWMLVMLAVAGLVSDPLTLLRVQIAVAGACWLLASCGLFALLRGRSVAGATVAAVGFAWAGMHQRLAFMGMENGLVALLSVGFLLAGARVAARGWTRRGALGVGLAIALVALARTEGVLLGPVVGIGLLLGFFGAPGRLVERARLTLWLAAPGIVIVGTALIVSRMSFGLWLPISGSVKALYEEQWRARSLHDGLAANLLWHVRHVAYLALAPLREGLPELLAQVSGTRVRLWRNLVWGGLAVVAVRALWVGWRGRSAGAGPHGLWLAFGGYALLHMVLMGLALPNFTEYGTWYFTCEAMAVWGLVGGAVARLRDRWQPLLLTVVVVVTIAGIKSASRIADNVTTDPLGSAGRWLERNVDSGTVIGTLSSGRAAWYAPSQHVVNLDGLINNRRYFEQYLEPGRLLAYFEDKGIAWFADYKARSAWQQGIVWRGRVPAERLVPRRYVRMAGQDAYVVWQVLPQGQSFDVLGQLQGVRRDRYVELAVAADVYGRFPVVPAGQLAATLAAQPELVVARSMTQDPDLSLLHILATPEQLQEVALRKATVWPQRLLEAPVGPAVRLLGWDEAQVTVRGERRIAVTLFWQALAASGDVPCSLVVRSSEGSRSMPVGTCHGTWPMRQWQPEQVVVETVVVSDFDPEADQLAIFAGSPKLPVCLLEFRR